ncbi:MAG: hypothetical protein ACTHJ5_03920 [Ilyomonas sp.]
MRILFLNNSIPNYVTDGLFHGLRSIEGITVIDIPRMDYMYADALKDDLKKTGSKGNTLYKLLSDESEAKGKRTFWQENIEENDLIIITDIFHQFELFHKIYKTIHPKKRSSICIVDGYDITSLFPFYNNSYNLKIRPWIYFYPVSKVIYFKREYENTAELYGISKQHFPFCNKLFSKVLKKPAKIFPISMSIPEQLIEEIPLQNKTQEFVDYNVDPDLTGLFSKNHLAELGKWQPAFQNEEEYYADVKRSKFGITTKREGWDCLRHYEYAAKGAILCFKHLDKKNSLCAPLGLNETNCISYSDKNDLLNKINRISFLQLETVQQAQYEWIRNYTTKKVASRFLDQLTCNNKIFSISGSNVRVTA